MINDSEILKIIKDSIYNKEEHKRVMSEPLGEKFLMLNLSIRGEERIEKIKQWLKEGK